MSARFVSSKLITQVTSGSRTIAVEYVDKTAAWVRPSGYPSAQVKDKFASVVHQNISSFSPETAKVAMKESEHQSDRDSRVHYTAYEIDSNGDVIQTRHIVNEVKK